MNLGKSSDKLSVVVAGVPRSYQNPFADGRWLTDDHIARIKNISPRISLTHMTENELLCGDLPPHTADVLLIEASGDEPYGDEISAPNMAKLLTPNLKWIQSCSSGVGHILDLELIDAGVQLTNAAGVHADALAESILAAILFRAKNLRQRIDNQNNKVWQELHCTELTGQTLTIIGTGKIGVEAARRAKAFGMCTVGIRSTAIPAEHFDDVYAQKDLLQALAVADFVVIACPLTNETRGMIGARELASMKPSSYLINIARGKIIDDDALLSAVTSGQISGTFLDALTEEPLPKSHPFWDTPGITVIPHDSHSSPKIGDNIITVFTENLRRFVAGARLFNQVDVSKGY